MIIVKRERSVYEEIVKRLSQIYPVLNLNIKLMEHTKENSRQMKSDFELAILQDVEDNTGEFIIFIKEGVNLESVMSAFNLCKTISVLLSEYVINMCTLSRRIEENVIRTIIFEEMTGILGHDCAKPSFLNDLIVSQKELDEDSIKLFTE